MLIFDAVAALLIALLIGVVLVGLAGRRGPGPGAGLLFFVVLCFFLIWGIGIWIEPVGPVLFEVAWLPFAVLGLLFLLLLLALLPPYEAPAGPPPGEPETEAAESTAITLGLFFYLVLFILLATAVIRYVTFDYAPPAT
jgi:hypothetical protein